MIGIIGGTGTKALLETYSIVDKKMLRQSMDRLHKSLYWILIIKK